MARALRVLLVANDGFSAGHVVRATAIARGLVRRAEARGVAVRLVLATTSQAHALLGDGSCAVVQLPDVTGARSAGFSDVERRRLVRGAIAGTIEAFGPDVVVCDSFPSGPHGELTGLAFGNARRVLVRRAMTNVAAAEATDGTSDYHLAIVADDPAPVATELPIPVVRVPPITLGEMRDAMAREDARRRFGFSPDHRAILVTAGGGGDEDGRRRAQEITALLREIDPSLEVWQAEGPLARSPSLVPLQPWLAAFDGAFSAAGYNTAHELAKARVPTALFAQPRPFDDQASRARRFAGAALGYALESFEPAAIAAALHWMQTASLGSIEAGGADRAADAIYDLVGA